MDLRATAAHRTISANKNNLRPFEEDNMQTQYNVLNNKIDLYSHDYKLTIEIAENGHNGRNIDYEIKRQKAIEQKLGCKFIRIDPDKEDFDIFRAISEIFRHIK